ncbi:uncharacterized protein C2orf81 homolog [Sorex fumeus]|uniref:uncharacterized protein C2orf81 homolog n=1 Tax=Sorex fumeus TaxID=62283 RepID=UPI0024AD8C91|nr:uncharacterized protein C2orf81 homolog [Sorex fumeus]
MAHEGSRQARDRGQTRSKAEKTRPPTVTVPQVEIVPGRLTEAEWMTMLAVEEGEEVVGDIMTDLLARVLDAAFKVYLSQQCIPFTISQAREAMLQITEWRFLARDEGESAVADDPTWGEDEEPSACAMDSWAQGSVPVLRAPAAGRPEETQGEDRGKKTPVGKAWASGGAQDRPKTCAQPSGPGVPPGLPRTPEPAQEAGPEASVLDSFYSASLSPDDPLSLEATYDSPHPSLDLFEDSSRSPHPSEKPESPSSAPSLEDFFRGLGPPDGAGDRVPASKVSVASTPESARSSSCAEGGFRPGSAAVRLQPSSPRGSARSRGPHRAPSRRSEPARMPRPWVRPLVEILGPRYPAHLWEAHSAWPLGEKFEGWPRGREFRRSRTNLFPFPPGGHFRALSCSPGLQLSPLNLHLPCSSVGSKIPSTGLRFLDTHRGIPETAQSPPPKVWPRAHWPTGWEGAAELLDQMWAGGRHPHVLTRGPPMDKEAPDVLTWPRTEPPMLTATSQVPWTPILMPEAMTLAPGVSMWNPATEELLTAKGSPPESRESEVSSPQEQYPIQTSAPKPLVTTAQLTKNSAPKVSQVPTKPLAPSTP